MIYNKDKKGFTLVELIVGVAIFSLVIMIAVSLLTAALRAQRKSIAIQNVQDNSRYLIGFIAKEIRMSEIKNLDGPSATLSIYHLEHLDVEYKFTGNTGNPNTEWQITRKDVDGVATLNSDEVKVEGTFYVDGKGVDEKQPRVTIIMKVRTTGDKVEERAEINLQTTLSQRDFD